MSHGSGTSDPAGSGGSSGWAWSSDTWLWDLHVYLNKTVNYLGSAWSLKEIQEQLNELLLQYNASRHNGTESNHTNVTHSEHEETHHPTPILFIFGTCAVGGNPLHSIESKIKVLAYIRENMLYDRLIATNVKHEKVM